PPVDTVRTVHSGSNADSARADEGRTARKKTTADRMVIACPSRDQTLQSTWVRAAACMGTPSCPVPCLLAGYLPAERGFGHTDCGFPCAAGALRSDRLFALDLALEIAFHAVDCVAQHVVEACHGVLDVLGGDAVARRELVERLADLGLGLGGVAAQRLEALARVAARLALEGPAGGKRELGAHHSALPPPGFFLPPVDEGPRSAGWPRLFFSAAIRSITLVSSLAALLAGLTGLPLRFLSISSRKASS